MKKEKHEGEVQPLKNTGLGRVVMRFTTGVAEPKTASYLGKNLDSEVRLIGVHTLALPFSLNNLLIV